MKKRKLIPTLVVTLALLCGIVIGAGASSTLQEIKAYLNPGITIKLNGEAQILKDANGNRLYPISYNGSTYLPIRAVAGLAGLDVDWVQATQTVELGNFAEGVDLIEAYKFYDRNSGDQNQVQNSEKKEQEISGITCSHWLRLHNGLAGSKGDLAHLSFNVLGKHDTLTFQYYANTDVILRVLGDNDSVLFETTVSGGKVAQTATVSLYKTSQLTFQTEKLTGDGWIDTYIFDTNLK